MLCCVGERQEMRLVAMAFCGVDYRLLLHAGCQIAARKRWLLMAGVGGS